MPLRHVQDLPKSGRLRKPEQETHQLNVLSIEENPHSALLD